MKAKTSLKICLVVGNSIKLGKMIMILHKNTKNKIKIEIFYEKLENAKKEKNG